jgi:hypothetical protein
MSASSSSTPASSKIPPEEGEALGELFEALLGFGDEHGSGPFAADGVESCEPRGYQPGGDRESAAMRY